jgi:hypothetical protein
MTNEELEQEIEHIKMLLSLNVPIVFDPVNKIYDALAAATLFAAIQAAKLDNKNIIVGFNTEKTVNYVFARNLTLNEFTNKLNVNLKVTTDELRRTTVSDYIVDVDLG